MQTFRLLKHSFNTAPILQHSDPNKPLSVEVDASNSWMGAILSQHRGEKSKLHPVAYFLHKLSQAKWNYDVSNRELLTVKLALEE